MDFLFFRQDIFKELDKVSRHFTSICKAFERNSQLLQQKMILVRELVDAIEKGYGTEDSLLHKITLLVSGQVAVSKPDQKNISFSIREISEIIKKKSDLQDNLELEKIDNQLKALLADMLEWREIVTNQFNMLKEYRLKNEHAYNLRTLQSLIKQESDLFYLYLADKMPEKDLIENIHKEIDGMVESWRPSYISTLEFSEIQGPDDPNLPIVYYDVLLQCLKDLYPYEEMRDDLKNFDNPLNEDGIRYHVLYIKNNHGKIIAAISFYFFYLKKEEGPSIAIGLGEYLGVLPSYRRLALGTSLVAARLKTLNKDAKLVNLKHVQTIFGEYKDETAMSEEEIAHDIKNEMHPVARKRFWSRMGSKAIDFSQLAPPGYNKRVAYAIPEDKDRRKIERKYVLGIWRPRGNGSNDKIGLDYLYSAMVALYKGSYGLTENHNILRQLKYLIEKKKRLGQNEIDIIDLV